MKSKHSLEKVRHTANIRWKKCNRKQIFVGKNAMKHLLIIGKSVFFNPKIMEKVYFLALQNSEKVHS